MHDATCSFSASATIGTREFPHRSVDAALHFPEPRDLVITLRRSKFPKRTPQAITEVRQPGNYTLRRYCVTCMAASQASVAHRVEQVAINLSKRINLPTGITIGINELYRFCVRVRQLSKDTSKKNALNPRPGDPIYIRETTTTAYSNIFLCKSKGLCQSVIIHAV